MAVCAILAALILAAYGRVWWLDFVNIDDAPYVSENDQVLAGFGGSGFLWAFSSTNQTHWHPLTWLSLTLDATIDGANPRVYHATNLLLHIANAILLFLVLDRMSGRRWRSAFVAALFAVHPLHVESVAWIAERKDVLSTFFGMLALAAYARYAERPSAGRYLAVFAALALSLMSKPMLVTLPLVMLLLDVWPLERWGRPPLAWPMRAGEGGSRPAAHEGERPHQGDRHPREDRRPQGDRLLGMISFTKGIREERPPHGNRLQGPPLPGNRGRPAEVRPALLLLEKAPLFALAAASSIVTLAVGRPAMRMLEHLLLSERVANALVSYVAYIGKMLLPLWLAPIYPHPQGTIPFWKAAAAAAFLAAVSIAVVLARRRRPWLAVGWLWYVVTLVPVIGLVQVGRQAMADRYTYVPLVGLFIVVAWGVPDLISQLVSRAPRPENLRAGTSSRGAVVERASGIRGHQDRHRAELPRSRREENGGSEGPAQCPPLPRTPARVLAACALFVVTVLAALTWVQVGHWRNGIDLLVHTIAVTKDNPNAHNDLAVLLAERGDIERAIPHLRETLRIDPMFADAHFNLANDLMQQGRIDEATSLARKEQEIWPGDDRTHVNLGLLAMIRPDLDEAANQFNQALRLNPDQVFAHMNLAWIRGGQGRRQEADAHFAEVVRIMGPEKAARMRAAGLSSPENPALP